MDGFRSSTQVNESSRALSRHASSKEALIGVFDAASPSMYIFEFFYKHADVVQSAPIGFDWTTSAFIEKCSILF